MVKAYDFKDLVDRLKGNGIEIAEESVKVVLKTVFPWLKESAMMSENKIDDLLAVAYPIAEEKIFALAEDINKADNQA